MSPGSELPWGSMDEPLESCFPAIQPPIAVPLTVTPSHACPYLPDRQATLRAFSIRQMPGGVYHDFMDAGFRRNGQIFYQPVCEKCRACVALRVPVSMFQPDKSQRRCWRKNQDVFVTVDAPRATDEKFALFTEYQIRRHASREPETIDDFRRFLYESPVDTIEFNYRSRDGRLLAVGICDICEESLSSVYFYYDPAASSRGLGILGAMHEIHFAVSREIRHYYLGYWIEGCARMEYKSAFRPCEILHADGIWRPFLR